MNKKLKTYFKKVKRPLEVALNIAGINLRKTIYLRYLPKYIRQSLEFAKLGGKITNRNPILSEWGDQAGSAKGHYFHQDLLVASFVNQKSPVRHVDIGSRIDGFVAHVASFRQIDVVDIRPLENLGHDNISFFQMDLMDSLNVHKDCTDSISCLHAIEHFGLGRYGDPIDPNGHIKGFNNIIKMLKPQGQLYISFPIASCNEVHFNSERVFHPRDIFTWSESIDLLKLMRFDYIDDNGNLHKNADIQSIGSDLYYGCGIYTFRKLGNV